jgi:hypothetical protein
MRVEDAKEQTYIMKISRTLPVAAALAFLAAAARADVKIMQATTVENPQLAAAMQSMTPEQRAMMAKSGFGGTIVSTTYLSGGRSRTDVGAFTSVIVDPAAKTVTTLNRTSHTYSTQPISGMAAQAQGVKASITPTGKTKLIQGHLCRDYHMTMTTPALQGGQISGEIWAAPDLPKPPVASLSGGPMAAMQSEMEKINGMPLLTTLVITGSAVGRTVVNSRTTSISTAPIPAAIFAIPAGYQAGPAYANPMTGGGMHP